MEKTYQPKHKDIKRNWHLVDAKGEVLGRLSTRIAMLLTGKHKSTYSTHMDMGDYVVVVNASKVKLTGNKEKQKVYQRHSGYPGGFKEVAYLEMKRKFPTRIVEKAVFGMLPDNRLKTARMKRLKLYTDEIHTYQDKLKVK